MPIKEAIRKLAASSLVRSIGVVAVAALIEVGLSSTKFANELTGSAFALQQARLQTAAKGWDESDVILLDLASLIGPRPTQPSLEATPASSPNELAPQWVALKNVIEELEAAQPRSVLIDWELGLGPSFVRRDGPKFRFQDAVPEETRSAYLQLCRALSKANTKLPVLFIADDAADRIGKSEDAFPLPDLALTAVASTHFVANIGPYVGMAPYGKSGLPLATSPRTLAKLTLSNRLTARPVKLGLFHGLTEHDGESSYWINEGFLPNLITTSVSASLYDPKRSLSSSTIQDRLRNKVVILTDVMSQTGDVLTVPLPDELRFDSLDGAKSVTAASGGTLTACALLTLSNRPLYALPHGLVDWLFSWLSSLFFLGVSSSIGWVRTKGHHGDHQELERHWIELVVMLVSVVAMLSLAWAVPWTYILFLGLPIWILTRFLDLSLSAWKLGKHLRSSNGNVLEPQAEGQPSNVNSGESHEAQ